ncbi:MAG: hypothetical protein DMF59_19995 [Acidobacteria bacterium]|nr:MAG: hypothetical protein DMF59_19995 [Acidobacteriota bacterium]
MIWRRRTAARPRALAKNCTQYHQQLIRCRQSIPKRRESWRPSATSARRAIGAVRFPIRATKLADERRDDEAVPAFRALLAKNPHLQDVWSKLGEVLVDSGRYDEAIGTYKSALAQSEIFSPDLALGLGFAYLKAGKPNETIPHAELAMSTNPREVHELLARAYIEQHDFAKAEQHAQAAIDSGGRQPTSILLLAEVQRAEGKLQEALQTIDAANARARGLNRPEEAMAAFRSEIANSPQHLQSYANLALIYFIEENPRAGREVLDEMIRKNPHRGARALAAKTLDAVGLKLQAH